MQIVWNRYSESHASTQFQVSIAQLCRYGVVHRGSTFCGATREVVHTDFVKSLLPPIARADSNNSSAQSRAIGRLGSRPFQPLCQLYLSAPVDTVSCPRLWLSFIEADTGDEDEGLLLVVPAKEALRRSFRAVVGIVEEVERLGVVFDVGHEGFVAAEGLGFAVGNWTEVEGCGRWHLGGAGAVAGCVALGISGIGGYKAGLK